MTVGFFPATTMPDDEWWETLWPDPAKVLVEMGVGPGTVAVDLCCGDGLFTVALAGMAARVHAIDIDPAILDHARAGSVAKPSALRDGSLERGGPGRVGLQGAPLWG